MTRGCSPARQLRCRTSSGRDLFGWPSPHLCFAEGESINHEPLPPLRNKLKVTY